MVYAHTKNLSGKSEMPALGLGTWQLTGDECVKSVKNAIQLGYRHIDTAEKYHNEARIGEAIKGFQREKLFITSKVSAENLRHDDIIKSCGGSLERLGTDYLDLFLIHWPSRSIPIEESLEAFKELQDSEKIRSAGVSNFFIHHLEHALPAAADIGLSLSVNQVEFHPLLFDKKLLNYCKKKGIILTAYSPLAREKALEDPLIKEIAEKYGKTPAQVVLNWELGKDVIVIPKAASPAHQEENMKIFDFKLDDKDDRRIDAIGEFERLVSLDTP
jgi:diketogulonate reductase-like aldo/keto reductase